MAKRNSSWNRLILTPNLAKCMAERAIWQTEKGTFVRVRVKPKSKKRDFVAEVTERAIILNLEEPAREGKANKELMRRLSKTLGVSTRDILLISGQKSREKILLIRNLSAHEVEKRVTR